MMSILSKRSKPGALPAAFGHEAAGRAKRSPVLEDPDEIAAHVAGTSSNPGEIYFNLDHPAWRDAAFLRQARRDGMISTGGKHHPIIHEMGELAMHLSVGPERFDPLHERYLADQAALQALGDERDDLLAR
jgi:hypothetical protein